MTISYTGQVANARLFAFSRLLFHWKGSIYKLMYKEMMIFMGLYTFLSLLYRFALLEWQKRYFERFSIYCQNFTQLIPLSFVLGFYVSIVVARWWNQFCSIPWPDRIMTYVSVCINGKDDKTRIIRRTLMRYLTLGSLFVFQCTSVSVKKRFPTNEHIIEAGVMTREEEIALEKTETPHGKWWVPMIWASNLIKDARREGRVQTDYMFKTLIEELLNYRGKLGTLYSYDWVSIPLVYTQVTTLAVYTFFVGCIFGRQFLDPKQGYTDHDVDLYVPLFTLLQFFFYMGWLKVAEQLINPFGEDEDDFDMNWIIDRNMQASLLVVDEMHDSYPPLQKDLYFDEPAPSYLPYTQSALSSITQPFIGSTADVSLTGDDMRVVNHMETIPEDPSQGLTQSQLSLDTASQMTLNSPRRALEVNSPYNTRQGKMYAHTPFSLSRNTLNTLHTPYAQTPFNLSKTNLDKLKVDAPWIAYKNPLEMRHSDSNQGLAQKLLQRLHDHKNNTDSVSINIESDNEEVEERDYGESPIFQMEMEEPVNMNVQQEEAASSANDQHVNNTNGDTTEDKSPELEVPVISLATIPGSPASSQSSSFSYEYEKPDSNQATVSSLTPLLKQSSSEEKIAYEEAREQSSAK